MATNTYGAQPKIRYDELYMVLGALVFLAGYAVLVNFADATIAPETAAGWVQSTSSVVDYLDDVVPAFARLERLAKTDEQYSSRIALLQHLLAVDWTVAGLLLLALPLNFRHSIAIWSRAFSKHAGSRFGFLQPVLLLLAIFASLGILFSFVGFLIDEPSTFRRRYVFGFLLSGAFIIPCTVWLAYTLFVMIVVLIRHGAARKLRSED